MSMRSHRSRPLLVFLLIFVPVLLFIGWSQASLNLSFIRPSSAEQTILLLVLSALIVLTFVIFALILARILLKLYVERRMRQLGSRFKTKMIVAFLALTLVPVSFLFIFAYGLLNRSIDKWFGIPFGIVRLDARKVVQQLEAQAAERSTDLCARLVTNSQLERAVSVGNFRALPSLLAEEITDARDEATFFYAPDAQLVTSAGNADLRPATLRAALASQKGAPGPSGVVSTKFQPDGHEIFLSARTLKGQDGRVLGTAVSVTRLPSDIQRIAQDIQLEAQKYDELTHEQKTIKRTYLLSLSLITLIILFAAAWLALFVSKQVTVPIQALAAATHEVSNGNLGYRISATANDELGSLIGSFNQMTEQLKENRIALERAACELQAANRELEERGNTMEAILENIPAGVISLSPRGEVTRINSTAIRMIGRELAKSACSLADLFAPEDVREINQLLRRAQRQGIVTRQMDLALGSRTSSVALTLTSIRARHGAVGSVLVLEDLTDLLQAQRAVAWQEVAQRIAHEIKNPLTPIRLSAERIRRWVARGESESSAHDLMEAVKESSSLIEREVETLQALVDEFSRFARFPASHPVASDVNSIVEKAVQVFEGRLNEITIHRSLAAGLPSIQVDPEQMKRALVNLIDNAAEALEHSALREIWIRTALDPDRDVVELIVADSGPGISAEAKERLFLPFFSTKRRGTGLGLAIVRRIISEHNGLIRVEENRPAGTKFIIELPLERTPSSVRAL